MGLGIDQIVQLDQITLISGDSTTNLAVIKAASTAALTTDTSLVVALSPNTPLPSGSATIGAVTQASGPWTINLTQVSGSAIALGQTTMSASLPVVIASNQSAILVSQSGTWTVQQGTPPWTIQGDSASGATAAGNPVQIGGVFNTTQPTVTTGQIVSTQMTSRGAQIVATGVDNFNINNISGTVSLPTGAATAANQTAVIGSASGGSAAADSLLAGGLYNTTLPTLTTGQQSAIQLDSSGRQIISPLTNASVVKAQLQDNSGNALSSTSGSLNVNITNTPLSVSQSGTWTVQQSTPPWTINLTEIGGTALTLGQATMAASLPIVIASNQSAVSVTTTNFPTTVNTNYGTVGASTIRTASQIGNANGAADFGAGTTDAQTLRVAANTYDGSGNAITSDNNGNSNNQLLHVVTPDTTTASTALGALNATIQVAMAGLASVGFQILSGTLIGTLIAECSIDGGTTWVQCEFYNPASSSSASSLIFSSSNPTTVVSVLPIGGSSHARVLVSAYTSGTANATMRASEVIGPVVNTSVTLPTTASKFSFGEVTTSASTQVPVESTTYTETTTNSAMTIVSSSTNDTSAGTGARTITVTYLDQTGAGPNTTTLTMNGTTAVTAGVSNMCFIEKMVVTTVGSGGTTAGTITLKTGGGTTVGTIATGTNQTFWAHHYAPTGKTSYVTGFDVGTAGTSASQGGVFVLLATTPTVANTPSIQVSDSLSIAGSASNVTRIYDSPIQVTGPARIRAYVTPGATSSFTTYASFDYTDN